VSIITVAVCVICAPSFVSSVWAEVGNFDDEGGESGSTTTLSTCANSSRSQFEALATARTAPSSRAKDGGASSSSRFGPLP
jgi:hypothetical protein